MTEQLLPGNIVEVVAIATAIVYVVTAAKEWVYCFLFGCISSILYLLIALKSNYYLDAILQAFYVAISVYGFLVWRKKKSNRNIVSVSGLSKMQFVQLIAVIVLSTLISAYFFDKYLGNDLPYLDAFISCSSIINTFLVIRKKIENWLLWIVINLAAIFLYNYKGYYLTSVLYGLYIAFSIYGYYSWSKTMKKT